MSLVSGRPIISVTQTPIPLYPDPDAMLEDSNDGEYFSLPEDQTSEFLLSAAIDLQELVDELIDEVRARRGITEGLNGTTAVEYPEGIIDPWDFWMTEG